MKLVIDRKPLLDAVQTVIGAVNHKSPIPALAHLLFWSDGTTIQLTANDLEVQIQTEFAVTEPHEPFEALWPAKRLADILKALPESSLVGLAQKGMDFHLSVGKSRFKLVGGDPQDFPKAREDTKVLFAVDVPQAELNWQLRTVEPSMASNDVRHYLNGICLQFGATLTAVATDGHRLSAVPGATILGREETHALILPKKAVQELKKHLGSEGTVRLEVLERGLRADFGGTIIETRLIDGLYPDWRRVVPSRFEAEVEVFREALIGALKRAVLIVPETTGVRLEIDEETFKIGGENFDEEVHEEVEVCSFSGDAVDIGFSPRYMLDVLEVLDGERTRLKFTINQLSIQQEGCEGSFVIMSMRL